MYVQQHNNKNNNCIHQQIPNNSPLYNYLQQR